MALLLASLSVDVAQEASLMASLMANLMANLMNQTLMLMLTGTQGILRWLKIFLC